MTKSVKSRIKEEEPVETFSYEQAFSALETVVASLETEKLPLDEALALFERGQNLARRLSFLLDQAELKVQQLSGDRIVEFGSNSQE